MHSRCMSRVCAILMLHRILLFGLQPVSFKSYTLVREQFCIVVLFISKAKNQLLIEQNFKPGILK